MPLFQLSLEKEVSAMTELYTSGLGLPLYILAQLALILSFSSCVQPLDPFLQDEDFI